MTVTTSAPPDAFKFLQARLVDIHWYWRTWRTLFIGTQTKGELLNRSAGGFFMVVQRTLMDQIVLCMWKLQDGNSKVLSFHMLLKRNRVSLPPAEYQRAEALLKKYVATIRTINQWRHNMVAHENHDRAMGMDPMGTLKFNDIDAAFAVAVEFMNTISQDDTYDYRGLMELGSAAQLLDKLIYADRYITDNRMNGRAFRIEEELAALKDPDDKYENG
jgi:hypothetical protein